MPKSSIAEQLLARPDLEWLKKPNFSQKMEETIHKRIVNVVEYIKPENLKKLTHDQAITRILRALHVYSVWKGRIVMYRLSSDLIETKNDIWGLFTNSALQKINNQIFTLELALQEALINTDIGVDQFPEEAYGLKAIRERLSNLKKKKRLRKEIVPSSIRIPSIKYSAHHDLDPTENISPEELAKLHSELEKQVESILDYDVEAYLHQMDLITELLFELSFSEGLIAMVGLSQPMLTEILTTFDNYFAAYSQLQKEIFEVVEASQDATKFDVLLNPKSKKGLKEVTRQYQSDQPSEPELNRYLSFLEKYSPWLLDFYISPHSAILYSDNENAMIRLPGIPYPNNPGLTILKFQKAKSWSDLFNIIHELSHGTEPAVRQSYLKSHSEENSAANYESIDPNYSSKQEIFSNLGIAAFTEEILKRLASLRIPKSQKLLIEIEIRKTFDQFATDYLFKPQDQQGVKPLYLNIALALGLLVKNPSMEVALQYIQQYLPNFFSTLSSRSYIRDSYYINSDATPAG